MERKIRNKPHAGREKKERQDRRDGRAFSSAFRKSAGDALWVGGRNSVTEALRMGQVRHLYIKKGRRDERLEIIIKDATRGAVSITEMEEEELARLAQDVRHQGVVAECNPYEYKNLDDVLKEAPSDPVLVLLDGVEDVRNIGAIVRTAECAGATAVLLPKHKSAPITTAAMKTAAGAFSYLPVCQIGNIRQTLEKLKEQGFWVVGADMGGDSLYHANLKGPLVIVMGAEGKGMSALTKKMCDFILSIPMKGHVSSLNVSVAAALFIYEAMKQRT